MAPITVYLENQTSEVVQFFVYRAPPQDAQTYKVAPHGGVTTISVPGPGKYLFGAWFTNPAGPQLYPNSAAPYTTVGDVRTARSTEWCSTARASTSGRTDRRVVPRAARYTTRVGDSPCSPVDSLHAETISRFA